MLTPEARAGLCHHDWPGNARELRNVLERAVIMCDGPFIDTEHLSLRATKGAPSLGMTNLAALARQAILSIRLCSL